MAIHQPLELEYWLVNVFSGSGDIFALVGLFAITALCAMFRMQTGSFLVMLTMFSAILFAANIANYLVVMLILILSPIFFMVLRRLLD